MSQRGVEALLGRLITDVEFRRRFFIEPAAVCVELGLDVTPRELDAACRLDEAPIVAFAERLDPRIVRAPVNVAPAQPEKPAVGGGHRGLGSEEITGPKQQRAR